MDGISEAITPHSERGSVVPDAPPPEDTRAKTPNPGEAGKRSRSRTPMDPWIEATRSITQREYDNFCSLFASAAAPWPENLGGLENFLRENERENERGALVAFAMSRRGMEREPRRSKTPSGGNEGKRCLRCERLWQQRFPSSVLLPYRLFTSRVYCLPGSN
jgi:hypothetical protein